MEMEIKFCTVVLKECVLQLCKTKFNLEHFWF